MSEVHPVSVLLFTNMLSRYFAVFFNQKVQSWVGEWVGGWVIEWISTEIFVLLSTIKFFRHMRELVKNVSC